MWYVIQVRTGTEESIRKQCEKLVDHYSMKRCFIPYQERLKRYRGQWHKELMPLFPGYIFADSQDVNLLFRELKRVSGLTKLLETGSVIVPLTLEEMNFLKQLGKEDQIVTISKGLIVNSQVKILEGPLKGLEGAICKIDRHKRKAWLELAIFGRKMRVEVGVEILKKIRESIV